MYCTHSMWGEQAMWVVLGCRSIWSLQLTSVLLHEPLLQRRRVHGHHVAERRRRVAVEAGGGGHVVVEEQLFHWPRLGPISLQRINASGGGDHP